MTDKVQKIKGWISKEQDGLMDANGNFEYPEHEGAYHILCNLDTYIDSLQEEPKFKTGDRIKPIDSCLGSSRTIVDVCDSWYVTDQGTLDFEFEDNWELVEEPVSDDFEEALAKEWKGYVDRGAATVDALEDNTQELTFAKGFYRGAKWQKAKNESTSKDLGEYINELSKQFPEVSFAKLSRIAVRVSRWQRNQDVKNKLPKVISRTGLDEYAYQCAYDMSNDWVIENPTWHDVEDACKLGANWQKENLWKPADCDDLPIFDREVIALTQPYPNDEHLRVVFAHRPNKYAKVWNSDLGEEQVVEIEGYDKGGWNIPNIMYWLDVELPKEIEL